MFILQLFKISWTKMTETQLGSGYGSQRVINWYTLLAANGHDISSWSRSFMTRGRYILHSRRDSRAWQHTYASIAHMAGCDCLAAYYLVPTSLILGYFSALLSIKHWILYRDYDWARMLWRKIQIQGRFDASHSRKWKWKYFSGWKSFHVFA